MKIKKRICLGLFFLIMFTSCSFKEFQVPEITISGLEFRNETEIENSLDSDSRYYLPAGVYFNLQNNCSKQIIFLETKMTVYEKGTITFSFDGSIESNETKELCIPVLDYYPDFSDSKFIIDSFYVNKVFFSDGSFWVDLFGTYAIKGGE